MLDPYIGGIEVDEKLTWLDGTKVDYLNWNKHEPSIGRGEDCAHLWMVFGGRWNDIYCTNRRPYICKLTKGKL